MLSIGKLGRGQENYYLATVATGIEDYYTGSGEAPGEWMGIGSARLGLAGEVSGEHLRTVLGGVDPVDGGELGGRTRKDRVPGWDLTFSAPKSVSVLYALGGDRVASEVVEAHRAAVVAGLEYLERHATVSRRRIDGEVEVVRAEGLVVAAFRHRTSRAGDPQLHTHCLTANAVERVDGGWGALHSPFLYRHARTAGFIYQAILRGELTARLGVEWGEITNGYAEIDGIDRRLLERFSKRRAEIEAVMAARGENSPGAAQAATLASRHAKDYGVDPETLAERWAAEADGLGREVADVSDALGRRSPTVRPGDLDAIAEELTSARGLTAEQASFDRREVTRGWCQGLPAGAPVDLETIEELVEGLLEDDRVVPVVDGRSRLADRQLARRPDGTLTTSLAVERRWSTTEMLAVEQRLLERAEQSRRVGVGVVDPDVITSVLAGDGLTDEQARMVRTLTSSGNAIDVVVGRAGTGKTYALAAAGRAWRADGYRPIGVAIAARAAAELESSAGLPSTTVAQFLIDCDSGAQLDQRAVVVVDEAGLVDTRRLARLVAHVHAAGAKMVLVGDHHQLPAVEAGGGFAALVRRLDVVELTENRRQEQAWERAALDQLRVGRGGRAGIVEVIERYDGQGRVHVGATPRDARAAMVADWYQARVEGQRPIMLALRRRDVGELNARARALLVADGTLSAESVAAGDRRFSAGDRVVCLHNDRRIGVHNALFATIAFVGQDGFVLVEEHSHRRVAVPMEYAVAGHLDHAYATTIHKAQGATYQRALLLGDDRLYRQAGYTGLSRGRLRNDIYLVADDDRDHDVELERHGQAERDDPSARLARALGRDGAKLLATDEASARRAEGPVAALAELWARRNGLAGQHCEIVAGGPDAGVDSDDVAAVAAAGLARLDSALCRRTVLAGHAAEIDRPSHIVHILGDPPVDLDGRGRWRAAAGAIESYRARWSAELTDMPDAPPLEQVQHLREVTEAVLAVENEPKTEMTAAAVEFS